MSSIIDELYPQSVFFYNCYSSADLALAYGKLIQHLAVYKGYKGQTNSSRLF